MKFHGATLDRGEIKKYFPVNKNYPTFKYFLFHYTKDASGDYFFNVYAVKKDGGIIGQVSVSKDTPAVPIDFPIWIPTDIFIGVEKQLSRVPVPSGEEIKEIKLKPKKDHVYDTVSYDVIIKVANTLTVLSEELKPSPPASEADNEWTF